MMNGITIPGDATKNEIERAFSRIPPEWVTSHDDYLWWVEGQLWEAHNVKRSALMFNRESLEKVHDGRVLPL